MDCPTAWESLLALLAACSAPDPAVAEDGWDDVLALARRHGVLPLLYQRCCVDYPRPLPVNVEESLRHAYLRSTVLNMRAYGQLYAFLQGINRAGIPAIVLKGACLAELVYGDIALRPMSDLDLLVRLEDLARLVDLSRSLGYALPDGDAIELAAADSHHHFPVLKLRKGLPLELHWTIAHSIRHGVTIAGDDIEALWSRSLPVTVAGAGTRMLGPEDLLLHQCMHLANNHLFSWHGLGGLIDVNTILQKFGARLDWEAVEKRARSWECWRGVSLSLCLSHDWLNAPLSEIATSRLRATLPTSDVVDWIREKLSQLAPVAISNAGRTIPENTRWPELPAVVIRNMLPPPATMAALYNRPSSSRRVYLDYPRQIVNVMRQGSTLAYRLLGGDREKHVAAVREATLRRWLREESYEPR